MFFRGDRRTACVEEPAWTNLIQFNEPLPRRTATQHTLAPSRSAPRGKEHAAPSAARLYRTLRIWNPRSLCCSCTAFRVAKGQKSGRIHFTAGRS
jgi:hypothetical protein